MILSLPRRENSTFQFSMVHHTTSQLFSRCSGKVGESKHYFRNDVFEADKPSIYTARLTV
jgi:hypothetical protein